MNWLSFLVKRKLIVGLLIVFVLLFGVFAINDLDVEMMPALTMDMGMVQIDAGELNTLDMEERVIQPIEDRLQGIEGVDTFETNITLGSGTIMMLFEQGQGDDTFTEVESVMNEFESQMTDIQAIYTFQAALNPPYELYYDLYGGDADELFYVAEEVIQPRLESLSEVREVEVAVEDGHEVVIELDHEKLQEDSIDAQQVAYLFQEENQNRVIGELTGEDDQPNLRWNSTFLSVEDIESLQISTADGPKPLEEYAAIDIVQRDTSVVAWKNGEADYIFMQLGRSNDVTELEMTEAVRAEVADMKEEGLLDDVVLEEMLATADYVSHDLRNIQTNVLYGGILALVIMLIFLRSIRATMIVGIAIPISVLLTFSLMWLLDYSINVMTLIALGLGIGMMVDAAIVILESIYRKMQQGFPRLDAVIEGTKEVSTAVLASMLTTVVVFLPIGILSGDIGDFIMILSLVIIITLVSSVLISFAVIPVLSEKWIRVKDADVRKKENAILRLYSRFVGWMSWRKWRRWLVVVGFVFMFIASLSLITFVPMSVMPDVMERQAELIVNLEGNTSDEEKEEIADAMHEALSDTPDVADYTVMVASEDMLATFINMTVEEEASMPQAQVNAEIMNRLQALADDYPVDNVVVSTEAMDMGNPVEIVVQGDDLQELREIAEDLETELENIEGITGIHHSLSDMEIEEQFVIDEEEVEDAGLTSSYIRDQIEASFMNEQIDEIELDGRAFPVFMRSDLEVNTKEDLEKLEIEIPQAEADMMLGEEEEAQTVELAEFVELEHVEAPQEIQHEDGQRVVKVMASLEERDLGSVNADVQEMIADMEFTDGYTISLGGQMEQQQEMMLEMMYILLLAIFLVYVVMAIQFNHLIHPFVVMSIIPMTVVGVILGLLLTQRELNALSAMGIVILIGIVLNNAILLIDRTKQLRRQGLDRGKALQEAGKNRMRPIFMTTLTTAAGMLPLALATGNASNYQAPMATVVISGLLFATLITLILIPAVYMIMEDILGWPKRFWMKRKEQRKMKKEKEQYVERNLTSDHAGRG